MLGFNYVENIESLFKNENFKILVKLSEDIKLPLF